MRTTRPTMNNVISKMRHNFKKWFRIIFVVVGLTITIYNININLRMYLQNKTKTEITIETNTGTAFPSITICLNSMHSKSM